MLEVLNHENTPNHREILLASLSAKKMTDWTQPLVADGVNQHAAKAVLHGKIYDTGARLMALHELLNHVGFDKIRRLYDFPPKSDESPDPVCDACLAAAGIRARNNDKTAKGAATSYRTNFGVQTYRTRSLLPNKAFRGTY